MMQRALSAVREQAARLPELLPNLTQLERTLKLQASEVRHGHAVQLTHRLLTDADALCAGSAYLARALDACL